MHTQPQGKNLIDTLASGMRIWVVIHPNIVPMLRLFLDRIDPAGEYCAEVLAHRNIFLSMREIHIFLEGLSRYQKHLVGNKDKLCRVII